MTLTHRDRALQGRAWHGRLPLPPCAVLEEAPTSQVPHESPAPHSGLWRRSCPVGAGRPPLCPRAGQKHSLCGGVWEQRAAPGGWLGGLPRAGGRWLARRRGGQERHPGGCSICAKLRLLSRKSGGGRDRHAAGRRDWRVLMVSLGDSWVPLTTGSAAERRSCPGTPTRSRGGGPGQARLGLLPPPRPGTLTQGSPHSLGLRCGRGQRSPLTRALGAEPGVDREPTATRGPGPASTWRTSAWAMEPSLGPHPGVDGPKVPQTPRHATPKAQHPSPGGQRLQAEQPCSDQALPCWGLCSRAAGRGRGPAVGHGSQACGEGHLPGPGGFLWLSCGCLLTTALGSSGDCPCPSHAVTAWRAQGWGPPLPL